MFSSFISIEYVECIDLSECWNYYTLHRCEPSSFPEPTDFNLAVTIFLNTYSLPELNSE